MARAAGKGKPRWRSLSKRLARRLRGAVRFHGAEVRPRHWQIDAFYPGDPLEIGRFTLVVEGVRIRVTVRTHSLALPADDFAFGGPGVVFTGVHPGAAIAIDLGGGEREHGAICALLAREGAARPSHFVTCGHMFPPRSNGIAVIAGTDSGEERVIGMLATNLLDRRTKRRDVALVELSADGVALALAGGPGPKLTDYLVASNIFSRPSRTFRPTTGDYSGTTQTAGVAMNGHVPARLWPNGFDVEGVIATGRAISQPGDSGTILATDDPPIAIGSCTADDGGHSVFEPLGRAIDDEFGPTLQLTLWRNP